MVKLSNLVIILILFGLLMISPTLAQEKPATTSSEPVNSYELFWPLSAGKVMGEPLYFLKGLKESFRGLFIFAQNKKIDYDLMLSEKRVLEAEKLYSIKNDLENGKKTLERAQNLREEVLARFKEVKDSRKSLGGLPDKITKSFEKQQQLLNYLTAKVSDQARSDIENNLSKLNAALEELN